ncbi:hypothetical protein F1880_003100 [Penicillium rolfsii]|nr:hypothetical protein F1880_003100 [Penicillium rolfsii]
MGHSENDYDWLHHFFPGWTEEDQPQGNQSNGGLEEGHYQNPHPAFADAVQMAQAAHAASIRFQQARSPQARAIPMSQQGQDSAPYSQEMDPTLFRSQLHRHPENEQPQQQSQTQVQQQYRQQALHLSQPWPIQQEAQAQEQAERQAREQSELQAREHVEQQARDHTERRTREEAQRVAQREVELQAGEQAQTQAREQAQQQARGLAADLQAQQQAEMFARDQAQRRLQEQAQQAQQYAQPQSLHQPSHPPVSSTVPQALRTYATTHMPQEHAATQVRTLHASSQPSAQKVHSISAHSVPLVTSKPTAPTAVPQMRKATVPPQTSARTACSMPAASASQVTPNPAAPAVPQTYKTTVHPQKIAAPLDNFTPFRPASNSRTNPGPSVPAFSKLAAAPSRSKGGRNSPVSSEARSIAGPRRKRGRPRIYPDIVGPDSQPAGPGRAGDRWRASPQTSLPPNGIPSQYQPVLSGLPVPQNSAPAPASASTSASARLLAPAPSWRPPTDPAYPASGSTPPLVNRFEPASSRSAPGARAIPRTLLPTRARQPQLSKICTPDPVHSRPASTQPPAAKMRKLDDSSRQPVTPSSGTLDSIRQLPSRRHICSRSDLVQTMKSTEVLIKSEYDPATIARDILIVADKHPTEKGLNHHLFELRRNFPAVDYSSNLATLRWDIIDPWVNYPPSVEQAASRANRMPVSSATRLETLSRPPNSPPRSPGPASAEPSMLHGSTRDVPTAPLARPADSRPADNTNTDLTTTTATISTGTANSSLAGPKINSSGLTGPDIISSGSFNSGKTAVDVTSTGGSRSSIVGLSNPAGSFALASRIAPTSTSTTSSPPKSSPKSAPALPSAVNLNAFGALPFKPPSYSPLRPTAQTLPDSRPTLTPSSSHPTVHPSHSSTSSESQPLISVAVAAAPQSSPKKVKAIPISSSSSTSTAPRSPSQVPKTPSRSSRGKAPRQSPPPEGLPEPQVVVLVSPQGMAPPKKKPGRPAQKGSEIEMAFDNRPAPQYQVFKCKWTECKAELHNLEAIHSHILAIHIPHHIVCAWADCTDKDPRAAADMWKHVREKHMIPLAWQLGDGPSASVTGEDLDLLASTSLT